MTIILWAAIGYLLGSVPFGIVITRMLGLGDLRRIGSGNIGATNVLRTGHKGAALATLILDSGKGAIAVLLARCAFHLGNRHTRTQVGDGWLRIRVDPVLREMLEGLGARVEQELAPFEPEAGAYGGHGHSHEHGGGLLAPVPLRQKIHRPDSVSGNGERA